MASYTYKEVPLAAPQGDELLVRVGKVALCGTDISLFQWNKGSLNCLSIAMVSMAPIQLQKKLPSFLSLLDMRWLGRYVVTYYFEVYNYNNPYNVRARTIVCSRLCVSISVTMHACTYSITCVCPPDHCLRTRCTCQVHSGKESVCRKPLLLWPLLPVHTW